MLLAYNTAKEQVEISTSLQQKGKSLRLQGGTVKGILNFGLILPYTPSVLAHLTFEVIKCKRMTFCELLFAITPERSQ